MNAVLTSTTLLVTVLSGLLAGGSAGVSVGVSAGSGAGTSAGSPPGVSAPRARAVWPLQPRPEVAAGFVAPEHTWSAGHRGVDLVGRPGEPVHATLPGRVTFSGTIAGRGVVVVDHGAFRTTYEPVAGSVLRGTPVAGGAVIGTLQSAQGHCPPRTCLHWGLIQDGAYRDPLGLLGLGPVRLLPD
ncbi:MAG: M23 family metallopeptidase [Marmoricola sp.]